jgi:hypothetical protein
MPTRLLSNMIEVPYMTLQLIATVVAENIREDYSNED